MPHLRRSGYRTEGSIKSEFCNLLVVEQILVAPISDFEEFQRIIQGCSAKHVAKLVLHLRQDVSKTLANDLIGGKPRKEGRLENFRRRRGSIDSSTKTVDPSPAPRNPFIRSPTTGLSILSQNPFTRQRSESAPRPRNPFARDPPTEEQS